MLILTHFATIRLDTSLMTKKYFQAQQQHIIGKKVLIFTFHFIWNFEFFLVIHNIGCWSNWVLDTWLYCRFPLDELTKVKKPVEENKDAGETEDADSDDDNSDADEEEDGDGDDGSDYEAEDSDDDDAEANGDSDGDEDDDDNDNEDDDEDDDDDDDEDDEDDDDDDDEPKGPPSKRKKWDI